VGGEALALVASGLSMRGAASRAAAAAALEGWSGEVRLAVRTLVRSPGFTMVVVASLAVGIGANAAVFGLVSDVLRVKPPYDEPRELMLIWNTLPDSPERIPVAGPDVAVLRERAERLEGIAFVAGTADGAVESVEGDAAVLVRVGTVTPDFFQVLGADAALGRVFQAAALPAGAAGGPGDADVAVLTHHAWRRLLAADSSAVGKTIRLNGRAVQVIGVMPPDFRLLLPPGASVDPDVDLWTPLPVPLRSFRREERLQDQDSDNSGAVVARLADGATLEQGRADVRRIGERLRQEVPAYAVERRGLEARPLEADVTAHARGVLGALVAAACAVFLVACLNVAGLMIARGMGRSDELAVRMALGAGRGRILRQLVVESLVLVALGFVAAVALAGAASNVLTRVVPAPLAPPGGTSLDVATLASAVAASGAAVILVGMLPARRIASRGARGIARSGAGRPGRGGGRSRRVLVIGEVALSVVLLLAAGLLLRTVSALGHVHPGFEPRSALTFDVSLRLPDRYRSPGGRAELMKDLETRLEDLPRVRAVGWVGALPLSGRRWTQPWGLPGQPPEAWRSNRADFRVASSGWFEAAGARLLEGRSFTAEEDLTEDERVVVVDEVVGRAIAPGGGSAVGSVIALPVDGAPVEARVVGVVEAIRYESLEREGRGAIYVPYRQEASRDVSFVVRTAGDPEGLGPGVRAAVREVDPAIPVYHLSTLEAYVAGAIAPRRFALHLLAIFAGLGLASTAVGLYGLIAFEVSRRTRDIGIRMAVGADPGRTVLGVLGWGMRLVAPGLMVGAMLAAAAVRALRVLVFGVGVGDPWTWLAALGLVVATALAATWLPARRAARLDPTEALRAG
jgi:predicted permease